MYIPDWMKLDELVRKTLENKNSVLEAFLGSLGSM
jgi:hypothetical protein